MTVKLNSNPTLQATSYFILEKKNYFSLPVAIDGNDIGFVGTFYLCLKKKKMKRFDFSRCGFSLTVNSQWTWNRRQKKKKKIHNVTC